MFVDRRQLSEERRHTFRVAAVFAIKSLVGGRVVLGQAEDIGPSGMTIRRPMDAALPLYSAVTLIFELPGTGGEMALRGLVVNDSRSGSFRRTGLRFAALTPEYERRIVQYCQQNAGTAIDLEEHSQVA